MTTLILAASGRAADTGAITAVHLAVIALLMAITVFGILWGARQKRIRRAAEEESVERQEELAAAPEEETAPAPAPPAPSVSTDAAPLTRLKGLGPKAATLLGERGIGDVGALAAIDDARAAAIDADMGAFSGRLSKDRWVEQARLLTAGDVAGYESKFGKLGD